MSFLKKSFLFIFMITSFNSFAQNSYGFSCSDKTKIKPNEFKAYDCSFENFDNFGGLYKIADFEEFEKAIDSNKIIVIPVYNGKELRLDPKLCGIRKRENDEGKSKFFCNNKNNKVVFYMENWRENKSGFRSKKAKLIVNYNGLIISYKINEGQVEEAR